MRKARGVFADWIEFYLQCCDFIGAPRRASLHPALAKWRRDA
jgi:hypothetical protein